MIELMVVGGMGVAGGLLSGILTVVATRKAMKRWVDSEVATALRALQLEGDIQLGRVEGAKRMPPGWDAALPDYETDPGWAIQDCAPIERQNRG